MNGVTLTSTSITRARRKVFQALRPFRIRLDEIIDPDAETWGQIGSEYERAQEELFKKRFPRLYARVARK